MKRIISLVTVLTFLASTAMAQIVPPKIEGITKGTPAPYDGVLLNMPAAAKILVEEKYSASEYELRLGFHLEEQAARFRKEIDLLNVTIDNMATTNQLVLDLRDKEITRLQDLVLRESNDYSTLWASGGIVVGVAATIAMFFLVQEVSQ
tara:strand:+ start:2087 stop:2533 length:447 start_codon:yes stop_codon:yes gene_type:complete